jgi:two-component sensor histidine kinase
MMEALLLRTSATSRWPLAVRYGLTTLLVLLVCAVRLMLGSLLTASPFLLFVPAVFLAALLFDAGTGLYATLLSAGLVLYFFVEPAGSVTLSTHAAVSFGFFVGIGGLIAGLTEALRRAMERARAAEREKDLLLHEVNHRIKNDLQILTSLVSLQRHKTNSPKARQALGAAMERITVLARVYDRLSHHDTTAVVDTRDFLSSLIDDLRIALAGERPITITTQLERVALTLECALPLGLIINELLTNALKYAFPEAQSGRIEISFVHHADAFVLQVRDNGVGMGEGQAPGHGLGQQLVHRLAAQLDGTVLVTGDIGVCVEVRFPAPSCLAPPVPALQRPAASGTLG